MSNLFQRFFFLADSVTSETTSSSSSSGGGSTEKLLDMLKKIVTSPIFYIVIAALVILIVVFLLVRRFVKPTQNVVKVVVRGGKIYKLIDEKGEKYFMVPFKDSLAAEVSLKEREFTSDKLFINNGPDTLYKINYTASYKVVDVEKFFPHRDSFQNNVLVKINDHLRAYADDGHALDIVRDYRQHDKDILALLNEITLDCGVEATSFKINYIEPMGNK